MSYSEIISRVSAQMGLPKKVVNAVYRSYWRAIREYVSSLPLKEDLSDAEFLALRPNINIPSIGKLYISLERYRGMRERYDLVNNINKENNHVTD